MQIWSQSENQMTLTASREPVFREAEEEDTGWEIGAMRCGKEMDAEDSRSIERALRPDAMFSRLRFAPIPDAFPATAAVPSSTLEG